MIRVSVTKADAPVTGHSTRWLCMTSTDRKARLGGSWRQSPLVLACIFDNEDLRILREQCPCAEGRCSGRLLHLSQPLDALEPLPVCVHQGHNGDWHMEDAAKLQNHQTLVSSHS